MAAAILLGAWGSRYVSVGCALRRLEVSIIDVGGRELVATPSRSHFQLLVCELSPPWERVFSPPCPCRAAVPEAGQCGCARWVLLLWRREARVILSSGGKVSRHLGPRRPPGGDRVMGPHGNGRTAEHRPRWRFRFVALTGAPVRRRAWWRLGFILIRRRGSDVARHD